MSDDPWTALFTQIGIIDHRVRNRLERRLPHGLTLAQYGVLNHFARLGPGHESSPHALADTFQVSRATMTGTLRRLAEKSFVDILPHGSDGRRRIVRLTPKGLSAREESLARMEPDIARLRSAFPQRFADDLLVPLTELREWLDADRQTSDG